MVHRQSPEQTQGRKRAVIFDFDGTIADSWPAIIEVVEELLGRTEPYTEAEIAALRDLSIPDLLRALHVPAWKTPMLLVRGRRMLRQHMHGIPVHDGMRETIQQLHAKDIPLYVLSSNSAENVQKYLQWHKLSQYFSNVYGGVNIFAKAPKLLKLLENEHVDTAGTWYVGDETRDVSAARAVGLHIASVTWGYNTHNALLAKQPDAVVDTAEELLAVLRETWKK